MHNICHTIVASEAREKGSKVQSKVYAELLVKESKERTY